MRENLLKKQPTWGLRRAQGTGQKSATPATLTKVILVLLTMFLLPSAAWGQIRVTKTITFNQSFTSPVNIDGSTIPVSVEEIVGGKTYTYNSHVGIYNGEDVVKEYKYDSQEETITFTMNEDANTDNYFSIILPGNYPDTPNKIELTAGYANAVDDEENGIFAKIQVIDIEDNDKIYIGGSATLLETTLNFEKDGTKGNGVDGQTNRDRSGDEMIFVYLNGNSEGTTTFTIKQIKLTYDIDYYLSVGGILVTSVNAADANDILGDGTVSFTPANATTSPATPATLTLKGASISGGGIYTTLENLEIDLVNTNTIDTGGDPNTRNGIMSTKNGTLTFVAASNSFLEITSTAAAIKGFQTINGNLETHVPYTIKSKNDNSPNQDLYRTCEIEGDSVAITWMKISEAQTYSLWVGDKQVTSENFGNIEPSTKTGGTASFTAGTTNTLTLNGFSLYFNGDNYPAITSGLSNLTIQLKGTNNVSFNGAYGNYVVSSVNSDATLTFKADNVDAKLGTAIGSSSYIGSPSNGFASTNYEDGLMWIAHGTSTQYITNPVPELSSSSITIPDYESGSGMSLVYSVDYVDETKADITNATYDTNATLNIDLTEPCIVTAHTEYGSLSSTEAVGKYFAVAETSFVYGNIEELEIGSLTLIPEVQAGDGIAPSISGSDNPAVVEISDTDNKAYIRGMGSTTIGVIFEGTPSFTVLSEVAEGRVSIVPPAPTIKPAEGTYMIGKEITITSDVSETTGVEIKYQWDSMALDIYDSSNKPKMEQTGEHILKAWVEYTYKDTNNDDVSVRSDVTEVTYTFGNYDLIIAGNVVDETSTVTGTGITGTVSYDKNNQKLTLNGATITGQIESSVATLKVYLVGSNTITSGEGIAPFQYTGTDGSLTFESSEADDGELTLNGDYTVSGDSPNKKIVSGDYTTTTGFDTGLSYTFGDWIIETSKIYYNPHYGITINSYETTKCNKDNITKANNEDIFSYSPQDKALSIPLDYNGSSTEIKSQRDELNVLISGNSTIRSIVFDKETGSETTSGSLAFKMNSASTASINKLTIENSTSSGAAIDGFSSVSFTAPMKLSVPETAPESWGSSISKAVITDEDIYDLWVGGERVTSGNKDNVKNEVSADPYFTPSVKFDPSDNILTLNGASIIAAEGKNGIKSKLEELTVNIVETNIITCNGQNDAAIKGTGSNSIIFSGEATSEIDITALNPISDITATYENGLGLTTISGQAHFIEHLKTPGISSSSSEDGISVTLSRPYEDGYDDLNTKYENATMYYSITYASETDNVDATEYTAPFTMTKPGTVTAYLIPGEGRGQSDNETGKYYGYPDAPYTMGVGDEITPAIYPTIEDDDLIGLNGSTSSNENIATFTYSDGVVKALATGTVTLTAILTGSDMSFTVLNPKESSEPSNSNYPVTFSVIVGENLNTMFAANQNFGTWYNTSDKTYKVPDGITAYIITGVDGDKVTIAETKVIPPNAPILMEKGENAKAFTYTEATDTDGSFPSGNILNYTTTDKEAVEASKLYVLYNGQFVKVTAGTKILANHCYLDLGGTTAGTRGFYNIGDGEGTTAIREVIYEGVNSEKLADGAWHDLQGRKFTTKPTKPGLYILNGKKIVIK